MLDIISIFIRIKSIWICINCRALIIMMRFIFYMCSSFQFVSLSPSDRGSCTECHYPHDERQGHELEAEGHQLPAYPQPGTQSDLLDISRAVNEHSLQFVVEAKRLASQCLDRRLRVVRCSAAFSVLRYDSSQSIALFPLPSMPSRCSGAAATGWAHHHTRYPTQDRVHCEGSAYWRQWYSISVRICSTTCKYYCSTNMHVRVLNLHKDPLINLFTSEPVVEPGGSIIQPGIILYQ